MAEWSVRIEVRADADVTQDQAIEALAQLARFHPGGIGAGLRDLDVALWVEAPDLTAALHVGLNAFGDALKNAGVSSFKVVDVELMPWDEFERSLEP